ncbi:MAG: YraN family protein [Clostridia bacterium]|nr:YraN family protein [Clostridia bacterium]
MTTNIIGSCGEDIAAEYLEDKDYEILERNYSFKFGEIDIIAEKDGCTVFVEVKTRKSRRYGSPAEYVDFRKQRRIKRVAACYRDIVNDDVRFDVIEILYNEHNGDFKITDINHIENAF